MSYWRDRARPRIAAVIAEHKDEPERMIRRHLAKAYPFGLRKHHPYRVWLDEINRQLGAKPPLGTRHSHVSQAANPNQGSLFK